MVRFQAADYGCTFYFTVNICRFLGKHMKIKLQLFSEYRDRSKKQNNNNRKTNIIASNSDHEPAVGTWSHNKMPVNMATNFKKKCMEGAKKL